jgi:hypothetical protein
LGTGVGVGHGLGDGVGDGDGVGVGDGDGEGLGVGFAACVTVTLLGLPVAFDAVTVMVPVRGAVPVFASKLHEIVPELVPLAPDVIVNHELPDAADHGMVPVPLLDTLNVVVPSVLPTFWFAGVTDNIG